MVLNDEELFAKWELDLKTMSSRIARMRQALYDELMRLNTPGEWKHILTQVGLNTMLLSFKAHAKVKYPDRNVFICWYNGKAGDNVERVLSYLPSQYRQSRNHRL